MWSVDAPEEGVAGQGWGQRRVVGMVQSSTPSHLLHFFEIAHFTTPPGTVIFFFQTWDMQVHQKLQVDHWTVVSSQDGDVYHAWVQVTVHPERAQEDNLDRVIGLPIFEERNYIDTSLLCLMLGLCVYKWLQTSSSIHPVYVQVTHAQWFNDLWINKMKL